MTKPTAAANAAGLPEAAIASDPLADLIAEYRRQTEAFNDRARHEDWNELSKATFGPEIEKLWHATPEPTSPAGVAAAIALLRDEPDLYALESIMAGCLRYLTAGAVNSPTAEKQDLPHDWDVLYAYRQWLHHEGRLLGDELFPELGRDADRFIPETFARHFHFPLDQPWTDVQKPSARARAVLEVVGAIPARPAAVEDLAAAEFEPWPKSGEQLPSNADLTVRIEDCIVTLRIAWKVMLSTKSELVTIFRTIDDDLGGKIMKDFISSIDWLKHFVGILESAEARLLSAGAVIELEDGEA